MSTSTAIGQIFELDLDSLLSDSELAGVTGKTTEPHCIESQTTFDLFCQNACSFWAHCFSEPRSPTGRKYKELTARIALGAIEDNIIPTPWGGVVVTQYEHPRVEKYLVIRKGGYLALEKHLEKEEETEVKEGGGLLLFRKGPNTPLRVVELKPGAKYHFLPGMEHCIIGTEDLLMFERSTDPKGMDKDLIFIYDGTRQE